jgi:uncharacterized membrane protein YccC
LGALAAGPWQKALTAGLIINFLAILLPSNQPNYNDLGQFLNSAFAVIVGTIATTIAMRLLPPISPTWRARRLVALTARDLCAMAIAVRWPSRTEWISRVCWRLQAMPEEATPEQLAQLELALSVGEALIYLRNSRPRLSGRKALDQAFASLAAVDQPAVSGWLSDFNAQQVRGATLVPMRSRAAATLIIDALSRRVGFLETAKKLPWH